MDNCRICKANDWEKAYHGLIRLGKPDNLSAKKHTIWKCSKCHVLYLPIDLNEEYYQGNEYQQDIAHSTENKTKWSVLDEDLQVNLQSTPPGFYRNKTVVDVGAGHGYFIDAVKGFAKDIIAVEPNNSIRNQLQQRGYRCYASVEELAAGDQKADIICSHNVLEHVEDPVEFIKAQKSVLALGGVLIASTPNLDNFLMKFGPDEYKAFFFRKAHRWFFNSHSLKYLMNEAGMAKIEFKYGRSGKVFYIVYTA